MFGDLTSIDFVGSGAAASSVTEAALLLRESTRTPTAALRDLPVPARADGVADRRRTRCVLFGDDREISLARYLARAGVPTLLVTDHVRAQRAGSRRA